MDRTFRTTGGEDGVAGGVLSVLERGGAWGVVHIQRASPLRHRAAPSIMTLRLWEVFVRAVLRGQEEVHPGHPLKLRLHEEMIK